MESAKFYFCGVKHPNCQHPQSDKTPLTCSAALQSKQIIRRTTWNTDPKLSKVKTQHKSGPLSSAYTQEQKKRGNTKTTWFQHRRCQALAWRNGYNSSISECQHGHCKHTLALVPLEIDSVYSNGFLPRPNLPHGEKYDNIYAPPRAQGASGKINSLHKSHPQSCREEATRHSTNR